eukprot:CAMPEP_0175828220 /NCGR_PEP_ID=MMETSP0107_2-20121207/12692_1 /TAXON_ID=195067 ORGANISM="Goniomonas pacifica, Strain CCMP1869" /NCGR_SAMPLE_ID=MMETSP0107_2 /ASSEMBLY_ACC=CAM_ASM_000203 /LENGTH=64 /DNA_ID=CAMNT_0017140931 /DNA_START=24 /DNA_END=218 /DNA_ORIENTATION=+
MFSTIHKAQTSSLYGTIQMLCGSGGDFNTANTIETCTALNAQGLTCNGRSNSNTTDTVVASWVR